MAAEVRAGQFRRQAVELYEFTPAAEYLTGQTNW
jgi:hypothetical protein